MFDMQPIESGNNSLDSLKPIYFPGESPIDEELFYPLSLHAETLDCMVGYFTSGSLSELALALSSFLNLDGSRKMRFIISPNLSEEDVSAIQKARSSNKDLLPLLFPDFQISSQSLKDQAVQALCYLVASGKIDFRVALKRDGMFHTKCWLFSTALGDAAIHGSGNATKGGLASNFEQLVLSRSWLSDESRQICDDLRGRFVSIWNGDYAGLLSLPLNDATIKRIKEVSGHLRADNRERDIAGALWQSLNRSMNDEEPDTKNKLIIPEGVCYETGIFKHQGEAVRAWQKRGYRGVLSIATGGGKTITSLIGAALLNAEVGPLFIVVAVPTKPLLRQWSDDVRQFSVDPIEGYAKSPAWVKREVKAGQRRIRHGVSQVEVIIVTHDTLRSDALDSLSSFKEKSSTLLIADEVHNLGSCGFREKAPDYYSYRLGLSATYERQFDDEGTDFIVKYFDGLAFEFSLKEAIGRCLVPFDYHLHKVFLTAEEEERYLELTHEIKRLSYAAELSASNPSKMRWNSKCLERRRLIEGASNKLLALDRILDDEGNAIKRALIFCTDKSPSQLHDVNSTLDQRGVNFHQVTGDETGKGKLLDSVLEAFSAGRLQVLTSKKVLDEGFNVPQTELAIIMASHTGKRQWIQRLGRVLRLSPKTQKKHAVVHDFLVIPPREDNDMDEDLRSLLRSEHARAIFFARHSKNGLEAGGAIEKISDLLGLGAAQ